MEVKPYFHGSACTSMEEVTFAFMEVLFTPMEVKRIYFHSICEFLFEEGLWPQDRPSVASCCALDGFQ